MIIWKSVLICWDFIANFGNESVMNLWLDKESDLDISYWNHEDEPNISLVSDNKLALVKNKEILPDLLNEKLFLQAMMVVKLIEMKAWWCKYWQ